MYTEEDRRRLLESRHDITAAEKPASLSSLQSMRSALATSRDALTDARNALQSAATLVSQERGETDAERAKLEKALAAVVRRYGFVRVKVQDALLNVDPDTTIDAAEVERRDKLVDRVFRLNPSDLAKMSQGDMIEFVGGVAHALAAEPDLKPLGYADSLVAVHAAAKDAAKNLGREVGEDAQAMTSLRKTRETFDRAAQAHALLVESILVRHDRKDDLGQFILARNASYAARRAARVPVSDEPGAGEVDSPIAVSPET